MKRYIPLALVLLGGLLVSKSVYYYGKGALANVLLTRAWEKSKETKSHHNPWSWADMHPVGRIEIESVGLSSVVLNTISGEALAFGPGHLSSTPKPGRPGNTPRRRCVARFGFCRAGPSRIWKFIKTRRDPSIICPRSAKSTFL